MAKQCLYWKRVRCPDIRGQDYFSLYPDRISRAYRGNLLDAILAMPTMKPITFADAVRIARQRSATELDAKKSHWYHRNFVQFISELGFHIELTGDEFVFHLSTVNTQ